jgi:hypothetical protein
MIPELRSDVDLNYAEPPSKTWLLDFAAGKVRGFTDELDAVAQSALMALQCDRYRHLVFSWQYGSELGTLVGRDSDYVFSEAKRMIAEALSTDTRITGVRDFSFVGGVISFTIDTVFGSKNIQKELDAP